MSGWDTLQEQFHNWVMPPVGVQTGRSGTQSELEREGRQPCVERDQVWTGYRAGRLPVGGRKDRPQLCAAHVRNRHRHECHVRSSQGSFFVLEVLLLVLNHLLLRGVLLG